MASRLSALCLVGLFVGCAAAIGSGCNSDDSKKVPFGEGGEGGEAGEASGGKSGSAGKGGAAGSGAITPEGGAAGEGGAKSPPEGGAAGSENGGVPSGEGGAAGALAMCVPSGNTVNLNLQGDGALQVCRGAIATVSFTAGTSAPSFTCCGAWSGAGPDVEMLGITTSSSDGAVGTVAFSVPEDAPLGPGSITTTCAGGVSTRTFDVDVQATLAPVVTGLENTTINRGDPLMVHGQHLDTVTRIDVISTDGSTGNAQCFVDVSSQTADTVSCSFDGVEAGSYRVVVQSPNCGAAVDTPELTIIQTA